MCVVNLNFTYMWIYALCIWTQIIWTISEILFLFNSHVYLVICHIFANSFWNICGRNFKFYTHFYICLLHAHTYNWGNILSIHYWKPYLFISQHYIHTSWTFCVRHFKLHHIYLCLLWMYTLIFWTVSYVFIGSHIHLFSFCQSYVNNSWNIGVRKFKLYICMYICTLYIDTNNLDIVPIILYLEAILLYLVLHKVKRPLWWVQKNVWELTFGRSAGRSTPQVLTSCGQEWNLLMQVLWDVFGSHFGFLKKR